MRRGDVMNRRGSARALALAAATFVLGATPAGAGALEDLIDRNQQAIEKSYRDLEQKVAPESALPPARLWIHQRAAAQDGVVAGLTETAKTLALPGGPIELKPVQTVGFGPRESQLRFFRDADRARAHRLAEALRELVPSLVVRDFSAQYVGVSWLKPGHLELWLAPDLR